MEKMTSLLRLVMSAKDAHYGGNLVDGAHMVHLFGDVATELLIKCDGDEGLFCACATTWSSWHPSTPATTSRPTARSRRSATPPTMKFEARKVIVSRPDISALPLTFWLSPWWSAVPTAPSPPRTASATRSRSKGA